MLLPRTFEERGFEDIGRLLGLSDEAARKRHERAVRALARAVERLRQGELP